RTRLGIPLESLEPYGHYKAKVSMDYVKSLKDRPNGKLILVSAITPTPAGEGKTTTTVGLTDALNKIGKKAMICLREPSLGPSFGMKGGAAGGGYAQVVPMEDINLHFTGDFHAITSANNLLAAMLDNSNYWGNPHGIDSRRVVWRRVLDMNDRALRSIVNSLGGSANGFPREDGFDITVASEVMAIFCLASDLDDLRRRLGNIIVGYTRDKKPVRASDLTAQGAMTALLKDALAPNLVQTLEGTPAFIHGGPFANIAHGCNSVLATTTALKLADYVVTEAGFGADLGGEKFLDIKCRTSGLRPDCVVLVATVRALKTHGGGPRVVLGRPLDKAYTEENLSLLQAGLPNLLAHIRTVKRFGLPVVVAINSFPTDTWAETNTIRETALEAGASAAVPADHWAKGGEGARDLAEAVVAACEEPSDFSYLYPLNMGIRQKIEIIARDIYGAGGVEYSPLAVSQIEGFERAGFGYLPICMAKTHLSISHDPSLKGAPSGFIVPVREVRASVGAGFIYPLLGEMRTMPGLGSTPAYQRVDIDDAGNVIGLF
ncbi:MAG TPA: formate--tetrahydrofolate ligase, partial [Acidimicrobiia bacterium]|nr:formate--tetrahydrofolate ligase [Acidimicrobiia bacterium]